MNSFIIGCIIGIIITRFFEYITIFIYNKGNKIDLSKLRELMDKGYKYFIEDKENITIYKKIKNRELIRELIIIIEGERRAEFVEKMVEEKMKKR